MSDLNKYSQFNRREKTQVSLILLHFIVSEECYCLCQYKENKDYNVCYCLKQARIVSGEVKYQHKFLEEHLLF